MEIAPVSDKINFDEISIQCLTVKPREMLAFMLNDHKLTPTDPNKYHRDYRGLAELMGINVIFYRPKNPMETILKKSRHSLGDLMRFLEQIDRFDVLHDCYEFFEEDAKAFLEQKKSPLWPEDEQNMLTIDDVMESKKQYDAFLLYDADDVQFAQTMVTTLESQYNLKICLKDRLLGGVIFEHSAIMQLISERCRRLIVLLSNEFVNSDKNTFYVEFARHMDWLEGNKKRFIIPVAYKPYDKLPAHYTVYFILDHLRDGAIVNFWEKLYMSIGPAQTSESILHAESEILFEQENKKRRETVLPVANNSMKNDCSLIHLPSGQNKDASRSRSCTSSEENENSKSLSSSASTEESSNENCPKDKSRRFLKTSLREIFRKVRNKKPKNMPRAIPAS